MSQPQRNPSPTTARRRLIVRGQVQGVGFRPFVYRLASELAVGGFVRNDGVGVTIELQGEPTLLDLFTRRLRDELPPVARIDRLTEHDVAPVDEPLNFRILFSQAGGVAQADVTPDIATCDDCLAELLDPANRRHGYPFINCTNCGPRYSIVQDVPYDRPTTTMSVFAMCPACQAEYDDPADRRFHAQPNACPVCGPSVWLADVQGNRLAEPSGSAEVIAAAADALRDGRIVAIRGLGGYHLAVRADDDAAVARLRERKAREHKPLAVMVANLAAAERLVSLTAAARNVLLGPQRPIVIGRRVEAAAVSRHVAGDSDSLGVMLPYTPLHHLLLARLGDLAVVMTSGNLSDEPIVAGNDEAVASLGKVADLFVMHNREIHRRIDDSVVELIGATLLPLRRARGYVPVGVDLPLSAPEQGLAVGAELKNTVAVVRNRGQVAQAIVSEHIGDLKDGRVYRHFERVIAHLAQITHTVPAWIAHDAHPMYLSSSWARRQGLRLIPVQHHHAHIAACLAEHGRAGPVIGIAADGVGYGDDGTIWGGEILLADLAEYRRIGHVRPIGLPGGDLSSVQTARPALAWLFDAFDGNVPYHWQLRLMADPVEREIVLRQLVERFNCPSSSALGRFFDAAAAILGLASRNHFEAQAPVALEAAIAGRCNDVLPFAIDDGHPFQIDLRPTALALVEQVEARRPVGELAAAFHNTIAAALTAGAEKAAQRTGVRAFAISGGVFCNRYLTMRLAESLVLERGYEMLAHRQMPCNDGGLSVGQAAVAAAQISGFVSEVRHYDSGVRK